MKQQSDDVMLERPRVETKRHRRGRRFVMVVAAVGLLACGVLGGLAVSRYLDGGPRVPVASPPPSSPTAPPAPESPGASEPEAPAEVVLSPEAVSQAGIKTAPAEAAVSEVTVQLPGTVAADAYREVKVVSLVGGIVTKVHVELGATVTRGVPLATLFSPELAEAQTKYLSMHAMLAADRQKLQRTQELIAIGAVSRQELEEITALHASRATEVAAARQQLLLLGLSQAQVEALTHPGQIVSEVTVPAPSAGVITGRSANPGQVVSMGQELFVVTDLSRVWAIGDLYEQDFQRVQVGAEAMLATPASPALTLRGKATYIDPRVDPQTRTAKVRVEVPNPEGRLRLGMYVTLAFTTPGEERTVVIPRSAVQTIGAQQVVFFPAPDEEGKFLARTVELGPLRGDRIAVRSGVQPGEAVVTEGSFFLRAEMLRYAPASL
jgi:membrane fusion protein, heavy metal efflux system